MLAIQIINAAGAVIGVFGFQSVPRVGEEIVIPGVPGVGHVQRVIHQAGDFSDHNPPARTRIQVK